MENVKSLSDNKCKIYLFDKIRHEFCFIRRRKTVTNETVYSNIQFLFCNQNILNIRHVWKCVAYWSFVPLCLFIETEKQQLLFQKNLIMKNLSYIHCFLQ
jgi:hypothetical protein